MIMICKNHLEKPTKIYGQCIGCELDDLRQENKRLKDVLEDLRLRHQSTEPPSNEVTAVEKGGLSHEKENKTKTISILSRRKSSSLIQIREHKKGVSQNDT